MTTVPFVEVRKAGAQETESTTTELTFQGEPPNNQILLFIVLETAKHPGVSHVCSVGTNGLRVQHDKQLAPSNILRRVTDIAKCLHGSCEFTINQASSVTSA